MQAHCIRRCCLIGLLLLAGVFSGCDHHGWDSWWDPTEGRIKNDTIYTVRIDFVSHKILELPAGKTVRESSLKEDRSYLLHISIIDHTGQILDVINDYTLHIDDEADDQKVDREHCGWFLTIYGYNVPFGVDSGS